MTRKILKVGTSAAVTIPTTALQALGLAVGDSVDISMNSNQTAISIQSAQPQMKGRREKITSLALDFVDRYREDLEALADE